MRSSDGASAPDLRSRVARRWAGYVVLLVVALAVLAATSVARVEPAGAEANLDLTIGSILIGGGLLAFVVGAWLWFRLLTVAGTCGGVVIARAVWMNDRR